MSVLSNFKDQFKNLLTVDATPSTPRTPVEDNLLDLFDLTGSTSSKTAANSPLFTSSTNRSQHSECKFDSTSNIKYSSDKDNDPLGDVETNTKEQKKNIGFKKKTKTKAKNTSTINYNIINSNGVKICPTTSYICNINKNVDIPDHFHQKSKALKPMPDSIRDFSHCKEEISQKDMLVIKQYMGSGWRDVARKLNYTEGQIEQLQENFSSRGLSEVVYQLLLDWKQVNSKDAKIGVLVSAMWFSQEYECVKKLEKSRKEIA